MAAWSRGQWWLAKPRISLGFPARKQLPPLEPLPLSIGGVSPEEAVTFPAFSFFLSLCHVWLLTKKKKIRKIKESNFLFV
jgi:hypothetical protein